MTRTEAWEAVGRRLGAPGVTAVRDPGPGKVLLLAVVVGVLWAQGGWLKTLAGVLLLAYIAAPGPDGKSLLSHAAEGVRGLLQEGLP